MMKTLFFLATSIAVCSSWSPPVKAQDRLYVDITEGSVAPLSIGIPDLPSEVLLNTTQRENAGAALARIVRSDLGSSAFFNVVSAAVSGVRNDEEIIGEFAGLGAQALVVGRPSRPAEGRLGYSCTLYDVFSGAAETSREFEVPEGQWRRLAHKCADMVYAHTTGYRGHFDTRFALAAVTARDPETRNSVIAVDSDGASLVELFSNAELVAMPRFSPDNRTIIFIAYDKGMPGLVVANLDNGSATNLQIPSGLPSAPRFSPDGARIVFALSTVGNTDIYELDLATGRSVRLTDTTGIDTSPAYSPDGSEIVFESDRSGLQQLYVMRRDGSEQRRISYGDAHASPVWSPVGGLIAFVRISPDGSSIGVMGQDGSAEKILTNGQRDEDPSWAPSGRAISFQRTSTLNANPTIWITDTNGQIQYPLSVDVPVSEPSWSEVLP